MIVSSSLDFMDEGAVLIEGFEYDFWANSAWLSAIPNMPERARPLEVMEHIAWAQTRWLGSVRPSVALSEGALGARLKALHEEWKTAVRDEDLRRIVQHRTTAGVLYPTELAAICRHVIDHGTYHRGQLRGLAEMQNWRDFPDVGLIGYFREYQLHQ